MKVITRRDLIRNICEKWYRCYWVATYGIDEWIHPESEEIYKKLLALDLETCSVEDVDAIIGNSTWTQLHCDECDKNVDKVVLIGICDEDRDVPQYCSQCILKAVELLQ